MAQLAFVASARAATFTAACSGTTGDSASLVSAIGQALATTASTVQLGAGCTYMLTTPDNYWYGPNGLPAISRDITIDGNGATIARPASAPPFRLFFVGADPNNQNTLNYVTPGPGVLHLRNVTLEGGLAKGGDSNLGGGGAGMGGAIFSQGTVDIVGSTLTGNEARGGSAINPSAGGGGGGIGSNASGNDGGGFGGGFLAPAGAGVGGAGGTGAGGGGAGFVIGENGGNASGSSPGVGGGARSGLGGDGGASGARGGDGSGGGGLTSVTPGHGGAFGSGGAGLGGGGGVGGGGGIRSGGGGFGGGGGTSAFSGTGNGGFGGGSAGSDVESDGAPGFGGGSAVGSNGGGGAGMGGAIFNMQGTLTIENSTIASNAAVGGTDNVPDHGKGIAGAVFNLNGSFTATGATFALNRAAYYAAQIFNLDADGATARTAQTTLRNTIVADGLDGPFDVASDQTTYPAITPPVGSTADANLSQSDLVQTSAPRETGTITGSPLTSDPLLGPLQGNGGPTQTIALAAGSPAIDAVASGCLSTDQRGEPRPDAGESVCDIGAFEVQDSSVGGSGATPAVGRLKLSPARFAAAPSGASALTAKHFGAVVNFTLNEAATVKFTVARPEPGRVGSGGRCVKPTRHNRDAKKCTRLVTVHGSFSRTGTTGTNRFRFTGRLRKRKLRPGRYRLVATPSAGGKIGKAASAAFRIVS